MTDESKLLYHYTLNNRPFSGKEISIPRKSQGEAMNRSVNGHTSTSLRYNQRSSIGAFYLVGEFRLGGESAATACTSRPYRVCTGRSSAHTSSLFISMEWVIVRNNTTIWPWPIRDLHDVAFPPSRYIPRNRREALPPPPSLVSSGSPPLHRFNGETRAAILRIVPCVRACLRACVPACTHTHT